ncbi:MAG TPA: BTAD domain-containing putative transcriptional regulator [Streptosporangiaceae bacterium]|nr:BTAD domain-containing putative transcriptional regulator [Streptosporangiaceae bacterium]
MTITSTPSAGSGQPRTAGLTVGILGPLVIQSGEACTEVPRTGQRVLLAMLAAAANQPVSTDELIEAVWGEDPSRQRERNLHVQMYQLRRLLAGLEPGRAEPRIVTASPGYRLLLAPGELDSDDFVRTVERGRAAARDGDPTTAAQWLASALAIWRGPALADVTAACPRLSGLAARLEEQRLAVLEDRIAADLSAGIKASAALAAELGGLVAANPLRERLRGQLMVALYAAGRQADALSVFRQGRRILNEELGLDPGPELASLHRRILAGDPQIAGPTAAAVAGRAHDSPRPQAHRQGGRAGTRALAAAARGPARSRGPDAAAVPRQLPADTAPFVGRAAELAALDGMLARLNDAGESRAAGSGPVVVIGGTAGIGKTTLAVHWAHAVAAEFPDGQLHADLRGYDLAGMPATAAEVIRGFLEALGVPDRHMPASTDGQAALYRTMLAGRRILMVLDNARDAAQVRPLLPSSPVSLVIVTSRATLPGLTVTNGAVPLTLRLPGVAEATELLAARIGAGRLAAEPGAAAELVTLCARLPLAIAITAAHAAAQPARPLSALAAQLETQAGKLDALDTGDPASTLRDVFACSCQQLSEPAARLFRLLGLHPGPDLSVPAAASLAAMPAGLTRHALAELVTSSLLSENAGRYGMHDLLRAYAAEQAATAEPEAERDAALRRVLDYYLHSASAAARTLNPGFPGVGLSPAAEGAVAQQFAAPEPAAAWFRAEHHALLAAIACAAESGHDTYAWQLPIVVANAWVRQGQIEDLATASRLALAAATRLGDPRALALARERMANVCYLDESYAAAVHHAAHALAYFRETGDVVGKADAHARLGWALGGQRRYREALRHAADALRLHREAGNQSGEASALRLTGWLHAQQSDFSAARDYYRQALDAYRQVGGAAGQADAWDNLGHAFFELGEYRQAVHSHQQAAAMSEAAGHRRGQVHSLIRLGDAHRAAGDSAAARASWRQALDLLGDLHHPDADRIRADLHTE